MGLFGSLTGFDPAMGATNALLASHLLDISNVATRQEIAREALRFISQFRRGVPVDEVLDQLSEMSRVTQMNFVALACDNLGIAPQQSGYVWWRAKNPHVVGRQVTECNLSVAVSMLEKDGHRVSWPGDEARIDFKQLYYEGVVCSAHGAERSQVSITGDSRCVPPDPIEKETAMPPAALSTLVEMPRASVKPVDIAPAPKQSVYSPAFAPPVKGAPYGGDARVTESIYETIAEELDTNTYDKGLWTKAFAQADGDEIRTKALYIQYRAERLIAAAKELVKQEVLERVEGSDAHIPLDHSSGRGESTVKKNEKNPTSLGSPEATTVPAKGGFRESNGFLWVFVLVIALIGGGSVLILNLQERNKTSSNYPAAPEKAGPEIRPAVVPPTVRAEELVALMIQASARYAEVELAQLKVQIEALPKPIRGDRKAARALNKEALHLLKNDKFADAAVLLRKAVEADASDVEILDNLGYALVKNGNNEEGRKRLIGALGMAPSRSSAWASLGIVLAKTSTEELATGAFLNSYRYSKNQDKTIEVFARLGNEDSDPHVRAIAAKVAQVLQSSPSAPPEARIAPQKEPSVGNQAYFREMDRVYPSWRAIHADAQFQTWLLQTEPMTGISPIIYLEAAERENKVRQSIAVYEYWRLTKNIRIDVPNVFPAPSEDDFWRTLSRLQPDWKTINSNQQFQSWLLQQDPRTGIPRQVYLESAQKKLDVGQVIAIFRTWQATAHLALIPQHLR